MQGLDLFELIALFILLTVIGFASNCVFLLVYGYFHPLVWDYLVITGYSIIETIFLFLLIAMRE